MATKHKVLKDFQLLTEDKKILILKAKSIIEDYKFKTKTDVVNVSSEVIKNNPDYFSYIDWKEELQTYLKTNKIAQPAVITKKLVPFIEYLMEENLGKEVIAEKPKIVEKEVIIEKPQIIEKEVIVEKRVVDNSSYLEIELQLNKLKLKEEQLDKEIKETNIKELEASKKIKEIEEKDTKLTYLEKTLTSKEVDLNNKEQILNDLETNLKQKESNLSEYVTKSQIHSKMNEYEQKGFNMDFMRNIINEI
jgi:hypothetical protein